MISVSTRKIYLAQHKVDFRKMSDGLLAESRKLSINLWDGSCVIFINRNKTRIKVLAVDKTGIWVNTKVSFSGSMKTKFKFVSDPQCHEISQAEMNLLFEGADYCVHSSAKEWQVKS